MRYLKSTKILVMLCTVIVSCKSARSSINVEKVAPIKTALETIKKNLDIYILIGQSNMAGRANIELQDKDTLDGVFLYTGIATKIWEKAAAPLNKYSSIRKNIEMQKFNLGYTFGRDMAKMAKNEIGLVVNAKGGTSIDLWAPNSLFYSEVVSRTKTALQYGELKGIIWHQGESDSDKYNTYLVKLINLIEALRLDFGVSNLPFIAGQLSGDKISRNNFNEMLLELPTKIKNTAVVQSDNTSTIDSTHFDAISQRLLGERYALEMKKLIK
ncbi:sialate O-acetylesterase [Polaribacter sp. IC066]|nr:sialate O-acetylesterase [Polaribacter sp. IC063]TXD61262.1 sialate O-acetylesterase [Polaribacter sp. IC066]